MPEPIVLLFVAAASAFVGALLGSHFGFRNGYRAGKQTEFLRHGMLRKRRIPIDWKETL